MEDLVGSGLTRFFEAFKAGLAHEEIHGPPPARAEPEAEPVDEDEIALTEAMPG